MEGRLYDDVGIMVALIYQQCRGAEGVKLSFYDLKVVWLKHPVKFSCVSPVSYFIDIKLSASILSTLLKVMSANI